MHIDPSTAQLSPYAGPNNGKGYAGCLVLAPALGLQIVYEIRRSGDGYSTEIIGP